MQGHGTYERSVTLDVLRWMLLGSPVGNHVIKTWQNAGRDEFDARWVGIGIAEDTDDVNFLQVGSGHGKRLNGSTHADHDKLSSGPCCLLHRQPPIILSIS
jgi:hypothetical protein